MSNGLGYNILQRIAELKEKGVEKISLSNFADLCSYENVVVNCLENLHKLGYIEGHYNSTGKIIVDDITFTGRTALAASGDGNIRA